MRQVHLDTREMNVIQPSTIQQHVLDEIYILSETEVKFTRQVILIFYNTK